MSDGVQLGLVVEAWRRARGRRRARPLGGRARPREARPCRARGRGRPPGREALGAPTSTEATVTRFGIQPAPCGDGKKAGSPRASQRSRPAGSVKPATGFQAAAGRSGTPTVSQPFHGKSFSLTVRGKIAELEARLGVVADVLDAARVVHVEGLGSERVAGDGPLAPRAQRSSTSSRSRVRRSGSGGLSPAVEPLVEGVGPSLARPDPGAVAEDQVGVVPARLEPGRAGAPVRPGGGLHPQRRRPPPSRRRHPSRRRRRAEPAGRGAAARARRPRDAQGRAGPRRTRALAVAAVARSACWR